MQLTVLAVPGCPNAPVLKDRLTAVPDGGPGVSVSHQVVSDEGEAARWGMHGSPTLLIDEVDPFAEPGQAPSMSCRLYRDDDGQLSGAPSVGQLRQALAAATGPGDPAWLDSLGRAGRGRVAPAERGLRAVHQAVLRSFVHTGAAPGLSSLARHAALFEVSQVLDELADGDFVCLDHAGQITAAYPFSAPPTRHRVRISGGASGSFPGAHGHHRQQSVTGIGNAARSARERGPATADSRHAGRCWRMWRAAWRLVTTMVAWL